MNYKLTCTVKVTIFAQYIFSHISRRVLDAQKFDVSENFSIIEQTELHWYVRKNLAVRISILMLDAQKFSCAKIYTFTLTVY